MIPLSMDAPQSLIDVFRQAELLHFQENPDSLARVVRAVWSVIEQQTSGVRKGVGLVRTSLIDAIADDAQNLPICLQTLVGSSESNLITRFSSVVRHEAGRLMVNGPRDKPERPSDPSFSDVRLGWVRKRGNTQQRAFPKRNT